MKIPILIHYLKEYKKRKFLAQGRHVYPFESYLGSKLEKGQFKKNRSSHLKNPEKTFKV